MEPSEYRMFAEEIVRLEIEGADLQQLILNQTERLRLIEQRIAALRSVVAGSSVRLSASLDTDLGPLSAEDELRLERAGMTTSLFGMQRAFKPESADFNSYRAMATPAHRSSPRPVTGRGESLPDSAGSTGDSRTAQIDKTL